MDDRQLFQITAWFLGCEGLDLSFIRERGEVERHGRWAVDVGEGGGVLGVAWSWVGCGSLSKGRLS